MRYVIAICLFSLPLLLAGCSSQPANVSGVVTADGEPVTNGSVTFAPVGEGRPAVGDIGADGSFTLVTAAGKGAEAGPHKVVYAAPEPEEKEDGSVGPRSKWSGWQTPAGFTVELKSGDNEFKIELVKP